MIITCENCGTRFRVDEKKLGATGRMVRCASCAHVWHQEPVAVSQSDVLRDVAQTSAVKTAQAAPPPPPAEDEELRKAIEEGLGEDGGHDEGTDIGIENRLSDIITRTPGGEDSEDQTAESSTERRTRLRDQLRARDAAQDETRGKNLPMVVEGNSKRTWIKLGWILLILLLLSGLAGAFIWKDEIAGRYDRARNIYESLGLLDANKAALTGDPAAYEEEVDPVTYLEVRIEQQEAQVVDGRLIADIPVHITNNGPEDVIIPLMYGVLCDALAQELRSWTFRAPATRIQPGKSLVAKTTVDEIPANTVSMRILFEREYRRLQGRGAVCEG